MPPVCAVSTNLNAARTAQTSRPCHVHGRRPWRRRSRGPRATFRPESAGRTGDHTRPSFGDVPSAAYLGLCAAVGRSAIATTTVSIVALSAAGARKVPANEQIQAPLGAALRIAVWPSTPRARSPRGRAAPARAARGAPHVVAPRRAATSSTRPSWPPTCAGRPMRSWSRGRRCTPRSCPFLPGSRSLAADSVQGSSPYATPRSNSKRSHVAGISAPVGDRPPLRPRRLGQPAARLPDCARWTPHLGRSRTMTERARAANP